MKAIIKRIIPQEKRTRMLRVAKKLVSGKKAENFSVDHYDIEEKGTDVFLGYYDINPFRHDCTVFCKTNSSGSLDLCIREGNGQIRVIGQTRAWCWQQGCRLRWLSEARDVICWNQFEDGAFSNVQARPDGKIQKVISWPLYDIDRAGRHGLSLNFVRLGYLRPGYGYTNVSFDEAEIPINEGIDFVDIDHNQAKRILTYERICALMGEQSDLRRCYINHLSFSPDGNRFLFFFIQAGRIHKASLFVYDIPDDELYMLENELSVSHYCWMDDTYILITAYDNRRNCRYYVYRWNGGRQDFMHDRLKVDGHPTWVSNSCLITDTYPDAAGFQKVLYVNPEKNCVRILADLYTSEKRMGEQRTDLHPRVDRKKGRICVDSNVKGKRKISVLKVECSEESF